MSKVHLSKQIENNRLTAESHFQDTRHVVLDCPFEYNPGDILMIWPKNESLSVKDLLEKLNLKPETPL